jgi:ATP adenylyltransferase
MTERLWAPWRMEYIEGGADTPGCIFCDKPAAGDDEANLIVHRGELAYVLMNLYPYSNGHLMVAPYRHVGDYAELTADELTELMALTQTGVRALRAASEPHGFNLGMNLGTVAGAGIADHAHMHLIPRWGGDTNFMPIVGQTRVLPELLAETWTKLRPHFDG